MPMAKVQRTCHQLNLSYLPSRYTAFVRMLFAPSLSDIENISRRSTNRQKRDLSHALMAGTNISINSTTYSIRGTTTSNSVFTLTGVPYK